MANILIVDDEAKICRLLQAELRDAGHDALGLKTGREALERAEKHPPDILLTDLRMDEMDGITLLKKMKEASPGTDVVVMTAYASVQTAIETMRQGAHDYIIKPFNTEELLLLVERIEKTRLLREENEGLRSYIASGFDDSIVGTSKAIQTVKKLIQNLSASEASVLIRGESGTGKELVAKAVHKTSSRGAGPFIAINCAAIPETLLESELFGYERGAFTGADRRKLGHFQLASGGTLFLDEIGELPMLLQSKLLRVLEEFRVTPLGGRKEVKVDIRLVSATNQPLEEAVDAGTFREDLYYRLNVFPINLPPLRDRREDIADIARHLLEQMGRKPGDLGEDALRKLRIYHWPGNVRELRNVLERATIVRPSGKISESDILLTPQKDSAPSDETPSGLNLDDMEKHLILKALKVTGGNKSEAARLLGITRRTLYGRLERHELDDEVNT